MRVHRLKARTRRGGRDGRLGMKIFRTWTFEWWEVSLLKIGLISFGLLGGVYFHEITVSLTTLWWVLFVATSLYFLVRLVREK